MEQNHHDFMRSRVFGKALASSPRETGLKVLLCPVIPLYGRHKCSTYYIPGELY